MAYRTRTHGNERTNAQCEHASGRTAAAIGASSGGPVVIVGDAHAVAAIVKRRERAERARAGGWRADAIPSALVQCFLLMQTRDDYKPNNALFHNGGTRRAVANAARREEANARAARRFAVRAVASPSLIDARAVMIIERERRGIATVQRLWLMEHARGRRIKKSLARSIDEGIRDEARDYVNASIEARE